MRRAESAAGAVLEPEAGRLQDASASLAAIADKARVANLERANAIESTLVRIMEGSELRPDELQAATRAAHQIAGSAGTFGQTAATEKARALETLLATGTIADPANLPGAFVALEALLTELGEEVEPGPEPAQAEDARRLLIAHPDSERATALATAARSLGWEAEWAATAPAATEALAAGGFSALALDLGLPGLKASDVLSEAARTAPPTPTLVLVPEDDFVDRVEAWRVGADAFVDAGLSPDRIARALTCLVERVGHSRARLLALDDDRTILDHLELTFRSAGMDLATVDNPLRFWDTLKETRPDLVLLDYDMPGVSGLEICRMLRSDLQWADIPVVFLTGSLNSDSVHSLFAAGADDYVAKPVVQAELVARVENRLERVRSAQRLARTDLKTGLLNRSAMEAEYLTLAADAELLAQPIAVAILAVDDRRSGTEAAWGRLVRALRGQLNDGDLAARWSPARIALAMPGMRREDGVRRLATLLDELAPTGIHFTAVVAEHGRDGEDLSTITGAIEATFGPAGVLGGGHVLTVGWRPETAGNVVDVLLVEDDEVLADVLSHSLQTRALRGLHVADGQEALELLTGPDPVTARVILLDVDLPGLNGLDLLRALSEKKLLERSRVVMLTAHGAESDVLAALQLGAFDHVAKPFSLPVLMHRVRKALDA